MIVPSDTRWWRSLTTLHPGTALVQTAPRIFFVVAWSAVLTWFELRAEWFYVDLTPLPFTLVGLPLGIFLGFRNNTSYDRFWEGRKLWGAVVNDARNFGRQTSLYVVGEADEAHNELVRGVAAYVHVLRQHLRDQPPGVGLDHLLPYALRAELGASTNPPQRVLAWVAARLRHAWQGGRIQHVHLVELERTLDALTNHQGGCERIKATPIPYSYTVLIHRLVGLYCLALPLGIVASVGGLTPVVTAIVSYAFFGLDEVGGEIEEPFGEHPNDLPLLQITTNIERNLAEVTGDPAPEPIVAVQGVVT